MRRLFGQCPSCRQAVQVNDNLDLYSHPPDRSTTEVCPGSGQHVDTVEEREFRTVAAATRRDHHYVRAEAAETAHKREMQRQLEELLSAVTPSLRPATLLALRAELNKQARHLLDETSQKDPWPEVKLRARRELEGAAARKQERADANKAARRPTVVPAEQRAQSVRALRGGLPSLGRGR